MKPRTPPVKSWSVYIARCANGALYTGITNRLKGRIADHNSGKGAKYTAAFGPVDLVWHKKSKTRSTASKLEARIKKMSRMEKEELTHSTSARKEHMKIILTVAVLLAAGVPVLAAPGSDVRVPVRFSEAVLVRAYPEGESGADSEETPATVQEVLRPEGGFVTVRVGKDPVWIAEGVSGPARPAEASPFGFHPASVQTPEGEDYSYAREIGAKWDRGGFYLMWALGQPDISLRNYFWDELDLYFQQLPSGILPLKNICPVQDGMVRSDGPRRPGRPGFDPRTYIKAGGYVPSDEKAYAAWVRAVVERYDGDGKDDMPGLRHKVRYWQVDNEPRAARRGYGRLVRITGRAIKAADPSAKVLLAGFWKLPFGESVEEYRRTILPVLKELGGRDMDIFDVHWYGHPGEWRMLPEVFKMIRSDLSAAGFKDVPVWMTEVGVYSGCPRGLPCHSEREQAAELVKRYVTAFGQGVTKVFWAWSIMNSAQIGPGYFNQTGLIYSGEEDDSPGAGVCKLGFWAYRNMASLLRGWDGQPPQRLDLINGVYAYRFSCGDRGAVTAVWAD